MNFNTLLKPCCIILVDDDEATNFINQHIIRRAGVKAPVLSFTNPQSALEHIQSSPLNPENEGLILLDINMPKMNGWEFLDAYQDFEDSNKKYRISMLSSSVNPDDMSKGERHQQISKYLSKPLTINAINDLVKTIF